LRTWRAVQSSEALYYRHEPIAALGDSLALCRLRVAAQGSDRSIGSGPYEMELILLVEVDSRGRRARSESFANDRLGDAVVRLYERYAELLPAGPERERAAATARSVAVVIDIVDPDRWATVLSPTVEWGGQGSAVYPPGRGAETMLKAIRGYQEPGAIT